MSQLEREPLNQSSDSILETRNLSVTFEMDRGASKVLDSVDLDIERGNIVGIVGESGSGKSMFASSLMDAVVAPGVTTGSVTYYPENGGEVDVLELENEDLRDLRWEEISMVFQGAQSSFNPTLNIRGHFRETLNAHGYDHDEGMEHARELIENLHMEPERVLQSHPHELSGGMKQRTLIALSLVLEPEVLVLDEPTASLDLLMQQSILRMLEDLQEEYDLTMVFITHDIPLVTELSDTLVIMYAFEFVEAGPTNEMLTNASHPYSRLLLRSTPNVNAPIDEMMPIEGSSPDPVAVPTGCSFHPRCPMADSQCEAEDPPYFDVTENHKSACFYWEQASNEISTTWIGDHE